MVDPSHDVATHIPLSTPSSQNTMNQRSCIWLKSVLPGCLGAGEITVFRKWWCDSNLYQWLFSSQDPPLCFAVLWFQSSKMQGTACHNMQNPARNKNLRYWNGFRDGAKRGYRQWCIYCPIAKPPPFMWKRTRNSTNIKSPHSYLFD